jgi:hypothetical protein
MTKSATVCRLRAAGRAAARIRFGVAPAYLKIAGEWQDHALYQIVNES